jgi:hypothetical protein
MNMKMAVCWDVAPCSLLDNDRCFRWAYCLHQQGNEGSDLLWNVGLYLPDYTVLHPSRQPSSFKVTHFESLEDSQSKVMTILKGLWWLTSGSVYRHDRDAGPRVYSQKANTSKVTTLTRDYCHAWYHHSWLQYDSNTRSSLNRIVLHKKKTSNSPYTVHILHSNLFLNNFSIILPSEWEIKSYSSFRR